MADETCDRCGVPVRWVRNKDRPGSILIEIEPDAARGKWRMEKDGMAARSLDLPGIASAITRHVPLYVNHLVFCEDRGAMGHPSATSTRGATNGGMSAPASIDVESTSK